MNMGVGMFAEGCSQPQVTRALGENVVSRMWNCYQTYYNLTLPTDMGVVVKEQQRRLKTGF